VSFKSHQVSRDLNKIPLPEGLQLLVQRGKYY